MLNGVIIYSVWWCDSGRSVGKTEHVAKVMGDSIRRFCNLKLKFRRAESSRKPRLGLSQHWSPRTRQVGGNWAIATTLWEMHHHLWICYRCRLLSCMRGWVVRFGEGVWVVVCSGFLKAIFCKQDECEERLAHKRVMSTKICTGECWWELVEFGNTIEFYLESRATSLAWSPSRRLV